MFRKARKNTRCYILLTIHNSSPWVVKSQGSFYLHSLTYLAFTLAVFYLLQKRAVFVLARQIYSQGNASDVNNYMFTEIIDGPVGLVVSDPDCYTRGRGFDSYPGQMFV
ncbi:unnamed protein product [Chrysodeixis includens]|uniref:Uncharacterized protein n=1 Tax=Chrysodeixis includens TaxID=689277 RepID=A0A9N8L577_CHRIL|nr:unnamed protein product [Chrysodeixis includens]